jgi:PAS domain S-box-containing protein
LRDPDYNELALPSMALRWGIRRMSQRLFERYRDLQAYVGWTADDAARVRAAAEIVDRRIDDLVSDFYAEIQRHPDALRVITGGQAQIERLMVSLRSWLRDSLQGHSDLDYVVRRWNIGLRHAEIGLNPAFTAAAMSRLRNGITRILAAAGTIPAADLPMITQSFNKLLDLDLAIIQDAYEAEFLRCERLAEHERAESKFHRLVEAAAGLVMILRADQTIAYASPQCSELTGHAADEVLDQPFAQLFLDDPSKFKLDAAISATVAGQPINSLELQIRHRDGRHRWFVWNTQRLDELEGHPVVLMVGQDFTERREEQERLLRAERLAGIGQMVTGIAHESRNALQRIQSCTEMLELEIEDKPEGQRLVRRLQEAQDTLLHLFDEVRNFAAPIQLEKEPCHVDSAWREAWSLLESSRRGREAKLVENIDGADLSVTADRFRIVQVFRNLLENSLAACPDPVEIKITCRNAHLHSRPALEITIGDNGPGLSPDARQSVFEPFFTTKTKGTGLGMAIARRIIDAHGGRIAVGNHPSPGAEFRITLMRGTA